jgi:ribosomal protein S18 acetylase RimI-like enzyme
MPPLHDPATIRPLLRRDPSWAVYPLGDLAPGFFEHCRWFHTPGDPPALLMLYGAFTPAVLFALGLADRVAPLLDEIDPALPLYLHVRPEVVPLLAPRYHLTNLTAMWRMLLDAARFAPGDLAGAEPLGPADLDALQRLYADGAAAGEGPAFFLPDMLASGVFYGCRAGPELVAVAGTHLVVPQEGVAAVGNIYTRRDRRGQGLAARVTAAVVAEMLRRGVPTVALNVAQSNATARRVYERLGFAVYCPFVEGLATPTINRDRTP